MIVMMSLPLAAGLVLALLAFPVLVVRVRNDPERCARGRFTYWFMLLGWAVGASIAFLDDRTRHLAATSLGGLVIGAILGNVVGRAVGCYFKAQEEGLRV